MLERRDVLLNPNIDASPKKGGNHYQLIVFFSTQQRACVDYDTVFSRKSQFMPVLPVRDGQKRLDDQKGVSEEVKVFW